MIDLKAPLHLSMTAIIQARVSPLAYELTVTGTRYGVDTAIERGIVDHAIPEEVVLSKAIETAARLTSRADTAMTALKKGMYPHTLKAFAKRMTP